MKNENRKSVHVLPGSENPQCLVDGEGIYRKLRDQYPEHTTEHLDNILNGLCAALIYLMSAHVHPSNHKSVIQLIYKMLNDNTE